MEPLQMKRIPKVELHCHLDGSIRKETLRSIYVEQNNPLQLSDEALHQAMTAAERCDLTNYLTCFRIVSSALHTKQALQLALFDVVEQAVEENIFYLEIRLSPLHLATENFSMEEVAEALIEAADLVKVRYPIQIGLIFCCMRQQSDSQNKQVIDLAKKFLGKGVVAIDLAGDELKFPTRDYRSLFIYANRLGIPYTVHAGETGSLQSVLDAIDFEAKRIGHGIALAKSQKAMEKAQKQGILLEMCPVCNIQTGAVASWKEYPVKEFLENGLPISFNTDNRTVSNTTLTNNFLQVAQNCYSLSEKEVLKQVKTAIDYLFVDEENKQALQKKLNNHQLYG
ncbi:adenosine deaminase [Candidatus Enterococcus murrayae]|uniref:Adenosine deaminase n=1 Tax=Candidatus Enterococcus murrayae TaxID=2815321 RepID=A0ABS3HIB4_9ENTE|nr:adenosine deaminase [Enterococcus sp. MJM16]MBO0452625.1 adenosine deaminase [Enterococcus sp. MJM16]